MILQKPGVTKPSATRTIQEADDFPARHRGINQSDDRLNGEAFHDRGVESAGRFLRFARREICDAKVRRLHGGHHAGDRGRDNESASKGEPVTPESIAEIGKRHLVMPNLGEL